jgi:signal transduction histidine kinase
VTRRLLVGYLALTVVVLASLEIPLGVQNARGERRDLETKVERDAVTIGSIAQEALRTGSERQLAPVGNVAWRYRADTGGRVVVVDRAGAALVDTTSEGLGRRSFASRPEIRAALRGRVASGVRFSRTLETSLLYVAVPVASGGRILGAVRITYPTSAVDARITRYWLMLLAVAGIVLALATLVGLRLGTLAIRPLRRLEETAAAVGEGDLAARAPEEIGPPEVRSLAAVFNETVAKLEQLLRSQSEFVADASHQLRTPLTALRLRLENLERDVEPVGRAELDAALAEVERLAALVESLLALARADAGGEPTGSVDLAALVRDRVDAWTALAEEHGVRLDAHVDGTLPARASEARLRQVLDNLIENAIEASPADGTVTLAATGRELRVRDEGPGMSDEERARAFDRFWRARPGPGSGLGLAIAKRLVEADGGRIALEPARGDRGGLEAVVRLRPG